MDGLLPVERLRDELERAFPRADGDQDPVERHERGPREQEIELAPYACRRMDQDQQEIREEERAGPGEEDLRGRGKKPVFVRPGVDQRPRLQRERAERDAPVQY